ncbi:uncharacterized protein [Palaemon carinicauda]|uniref:uncharacterized protein n=1 Tax=Palaemon carinicauda TaxID=392227 RepID=UPI0035B5AF6B
MKIWEKINEKRLGDETTISEEQLGFMPGRGTVDVIFALRQMIEKHWERQKGLHIVLIDLEKAYDRVSCQELWRWVCTEPLPIDLSMDVVTQGLDQSPWCMFFADDVMLCSTRREVVEEKQEEWRREMENRGLTISKKKIRVFEIEKWGEWGH